jgi:hypothetical protein
MEPLSREYLRRLKAQTDEKNRIFFIDQQVQQIYLKVKQTAETTTNTSFKQEVPNINLKVYEQHKQQTGTIHPHQYFRDNIEDIINKLKEIFPDSSVEFKRLSRGQDGKMYDIKDIDEKMKPFINISLNQDFIIVDWT